VPFGLKHYNRNGNVAYGERQGRLSTKDGRIVLDFGDGKLERLDLVSGGLRIEHFNPASSYPDKPTTIAEASKVVKQPEGRRAYRALQGAWTIKYTNGATRIYLIDSFGNVAFPAEKLHGRLASKDGDILLDFGDGKLERLELAGSSLRIEHYEPAKMYPSDFQLFAVGTRP